MQSKLLAKPEVVHPVVLLIMLQGSFQTSQLSGVAQPFEVIPFRLDSDALRKVAPVLVKDETDRQAFCQAFAGKPAQLVAIVVSDASAHRQVIRMFTKSDEPELSLFGDELRFQQAELVVPIDLDAQDEVGHLTWSQVTEAIAKNMSMIGVSQELLVAKMNVVLGQMRAYRTYCAVCRPEVAHQYA